MRNLLPFAWVLSCLGAFSQITYATSVSFYDQPQAQAKITQINTDPKDLLYIIAKNDWYKVADTKTGNVGWMKKDQYEKFTGLNQSPNFRNTVDSSQSFMMIYKEAAGSKPSLVVYKNGQRVSDKEAQQIYQEMNSKKNEQKINEQLALDDAMMKQSLMDAQHQMNALMATQIDMPTVIIYSPQPSFEKQNAKREYMMTFSQFSFNPNLKLEAIKQQNHD